MLIIIIILISAFVWGGTICIKINSAQFSKFRNIVLYYIIIKKGTIL